MLKGHHRCGGGGLYAYLTDRVAVNAGRRQTYGTQGGCIGDKVWRETPLIAPADVDTLRAGVGLEPMAAYRARFTCR